ncbi:nucleolar complex protein 4 homolog [Chiloscyllium plagiosum]|uniref:nucleolar complex protein 4 homolog n=1 Tax=Chiloscyllium plagiosum TaxID=36176 RepID=UPI001CB84390|nr:nucleolar complex protein 4 homolog [Chiloscyllium plagiosum]
MAAAAEHETESPAGARAPSPAPASQPPRYRQLLELVLGSRKNANSVFDILEGLEAEDEAEILTATATCSKLFCTLLQQGEVFFGQLPGEEEYLSGICQKVDLRLNISSLIPIPGPNTTVFHQFLLQMWGCAETENIGPVTDMELVYNLNSTNCVYFLYSVVDRIIEVALCTLMKFVQAEGRWPLDRYEDNEWNIFPQGLLKLLVDNLLQIERDTLSLLSRFQEYMEYEDVRYYVMVYAVDNISRIMQNSKGDLLPVYQQNTFCLLSLIRMPAEQKELSNFLVKQQSKHTEWKAARLKEHRRVFERLWLAFLRQKLSTNLYKKVLVILHESILPHMSKPTLMIDFLTAAYDIGGAISLLALNGLFYLIHHHNLEYPDFYKKLYSLLDPSVLHVKYRARFFHLLNVFLSSSHLPAYLVAAFSKRLSRLALTSPPQALLMLIPFICNLIRRHPSCKLLIHRSNQPQDLSADPYIMEQEDPAKCRAMESSLWEIQTLQYHYHPDVANQAATINKALSSQESDLSTLLDLSVSELFEREPKKRIKSIPLEFEPAEGLLGKRNDLVRHHWTLE